MTDQPKLQENHSIDQLHAIRGYAIAPKFDIPKDEQRNLTSASDTILKSRINK